MKTKLLTVQEVLSPGISNAFRSFFTAGPTQLSKPSVESCNAPEGLSCVYFIQNGEAGSIKIGTTTNVEERMRSMRTGNPIKLVLLATLPGGRSREQQLHQQFKQSLVRGEWFHPTPDILEFIRTTKAVHTEDPQ